jgi:hypothetical protein
MFDTEKFGEKIRVKIAIDQKTYQSASISIQKANGLNHKDLTIRLLVPASTLCKLAKAKLERGEKIVPTTTKLLAICTWLDVDPRTFWSGWDHGAAPGCPPYPPVKWPDDWSPTWQSRTLPPPEPEALNLQVSHVLCKEIGRLPMNEDNEEEWRESLKQVRAQLDSIERHLTTVQADDLGVLRRET